jgi:hypothetical protein
MSKQVKDDSLFGKLLKNGIYGAYYFISKEKCIDQNDLVKANPDLNLTLELWNMMENKLVA